MCFKKSAWVDLNKINYLNNIWGVLGSDDVKICNYTLLSNCNKFILKLWIVEIDVKNFKFSCICTDNNCNKSEKV
jgi:hypothetical protein